MEIVLAAPSDPTITIPGMSMDEIHKEVPLHRWGKGPAEYDFKHVAEQITWSNVADALPLGSRLEYIGERDFWRGVVRAAYVIGYSTSMYRGEAEPAYDIRFSEVVGYQSEADRTAFWERCNASGTDRVIKRPVAVRRLLMPNSGWSIESIADPVSDTDTSTTPDNSDDSASECWVSDLLADQNKLLQQQVAQSERIAVALEQLVTILGGQEKEDPTVTNLPELSAAPPVESARATAIRENGRLDLGIPTEPYRPKA
jgi:hypothetical protein